MYEKSKIRTAVVPDGDFAWQVIASTDRVLYRSPLHLSFSSAKGFKSDLDDALKNSMCLWCGQPLEFVTEIDGLDIFGFDSKECHDEAMIEADAMR